MHAFHLVNAFTTDPFAGNPAAVLVLDGTEWPGEAWMQGVAAQFNLSETAFVRPAGPGRFDLRWLTPKTEVDLCGHATLATAHVLFQRGSGAGDRVEFGTRSGPLTVRRLPDGRLAMDFPAGGVETVEAPSGLLEALGARAVYVGRAREDYLVEVADEGQVRALSPDFGALARVECRGVCVTARANAASGVDFVSRFFAPRVGVPEDPVTGSAHCRLAPYWALKLGKNPMQARQVSARGGEMEVQVAGERVILTGSAVTVGQGELRI